MSGNPESDYFMNESVSDVIFVVEDQQIPALKAFLCLKSTVFRDLLSSKSNDNKNKCFVFIEDTTYAAFKTFLRFFYLEELDLKYDNDFKLIEDIIRLTIRYDVYRLRDRITDELFNMSFILINGSDVEFEDNWRKMRSILKIGFEFQIEKLIENVMIFIAKKFDHFVDEDIGVLIQLNDWTDGRLFSLMADKCSEFWRELTELKESLKLIKTFRCDGCKNNIKVDGISSTKCMGCGRPLFKNKVEI